MKKFVLIIFSAALIAGCMGGKKSTPYVHQDSAAAQQAKAAQAEAEMEADIARGEPSLTIPSSPKPAEPQKPKPVMKPIPQKKMMSLGSLKPKTKYPLKGGLPVWFYTPVYDGYIGAVGIAPKQNRGGYSTQKRVARMQAQKNLAKQIKVLVNSDLTVESLNVDRETVKYYRQKVSSLTKEQVDQYLTGFKVMDEFIEPESGEYYMWMVLQR
jgi:hypothetical protein